jgi:hypothetical protein
MLKERTLLHLLLSTARALETVPENSPHYSDIQHICESLQVSRERRGPFVVTFDFDGRTKRIEIAEQTFRFHERGDVPAQVKLRGGASDAREQNWSAAIRLWNEILEVELHQSSGLAPHRLAKIEPIHKLRIGFLVIGACLCLSGIASDNVALDFIGMGLILPLVYTHILNALVSPLILIAMFVLVPDIRPYVSLLLLVSGYSLDRMFAWPKGNFYRVVGIMMAVLMSPASSSAYLLIIAFEIVLAVIQRRKALLIWSCMGALLLAAWLSQEPPTGLFFGRAQLLVLFFAIVCTSSCFTVASDNDVIRISAPIAVFLLSMLYTSLVLGPVLMLIVWTLAPWVKRSTVKVETQSVRVFVKPRTT